jgi:hypothetical protein
MTNFARSKLSSVRLPVDPAAMMAATGSSQSAEKREFGKCWIYVAAHVNILHS